MKIDIDLGKVGITPCGDWDISAVYEKLALVSYNGSSYLSRKPNRGVTPEGNTDVWQLVASKGDKGKKGDTGGEGLDGIDGINGIDGTSTGGTVAGGDTFGVAYHTDGILYWTKNGSWLLNPSTREKIPVYQTGTSDNPDTTTGTADARFKASVFKRSSTKPAAPTGGSFNAPVPSGWSDAIPADVNNTPVWMSVRWFFEDATRTAATTWSDPVQITDTSNIIYQFSSVEDIGELTPYGNYPSSKSNVWHTTGNDQDIWMAMRVRNNDVWGPWSVMKVKGEKGETGGGITLKGSLSSVSDLDSITNPDIGDAYIIDGHIYVWDGTDWVELSFTDGAPGLSIQLSHSTAIFRKGTSSAADGQTDTIYVIAHLGSIRAVATIGTITGAETGLTATIENNNSTSARIDIAVSSSLTQDGTLEIPITVAGEAVTLYYSWKLVGVVSGANGYNSAIVRLYMRSSSGTSNMSSPGAGSFTFSTANLSLQASTGWQDNVPDGTDPVFFTEAHLSSQDDTAEILDGWTSQGGSWSFPVRLTGENGLRGKVMRGVNLFSSTGLLSTSTNDETFNINRDYQGLNDSDTSHLYYDIVYIINNEGDREYYYCQYAVYGGRLARTYAPGTNAAVWVKATNFDFVATKVLLAKNGYIDILSTNGVYAYADDMLTVVAGLQGGSGLMLFAGADREGAESAPFRVYADGTMYASLGFFSGGIRMPFSTLMGTTSSPRALTYADCYLKVVYQSVGSSSDRRVVATLPAPSANYNGHVFNIIIPPTTGLLTDTDQLPGLKVVSSANKIYNFYSGPADEAIGSFEVGAGFLQIVCDGSEWIVMQHPQQVTETLAGGDVIKINKTGGYATGSGGTPIGGATYDENNHTIHFCETFDREEYPL